VDAVNVNIVCVCVCVCFECFKLPYSGSLVFHEALDKKLAHYNLLLYSMSEWILNGLNGFKDQLTARYINKFPFGSQRKLR